eukprot:TRINITY_DN1499_c0_g1_i2.p1 TRINITY_DN1499_c0_g1~~TRINITY_DN1499_c0_g1_i2.p1  ORF type:complete len:250 (-),score=39.69 TRINITY_DN1499_c0_g1_i2:23-772(-)
MVFGIVPKLQNKVISSYNWPAPVKSVLASPAGPFTIFFWCPLMKWGIFYANLNDLKKPLETVSTNIQLVLLLSTAVWTRWSLIITPVNYSLAAVNAACCVTAAYQLKRKWSSGQFFDKYQGRKQTCDRFSIKIEKKSSRSSDSINRINIFLFEDELPAALNFFLLQRICNRDYSDRLLTNPKDSLFAYLAASWRFLYQYYATYVVAMAFPHSSQAVSYTHLRAHETDSYLVCRLLLEKKKRSRHSLNLF